MSGPSVVVTGDPRSCPECIRLYGARTEAWARRDRDAEAARGEEILQHLLASHGPEAARAVPPPHSGCLTCSRILLARAVARREGDFAGAEALSAELVQHQLS
ncbi:hypothetical protein ABZ769_09585 [Streptomyces olivoreticuli]